MPERERWASLISGSGSTMGKMIKAIKSEEIPMDIACIISSTPKAGGIQRAKDLEIPPKDVIVVDPNEYRGGDQKVDEISFGVAILKELRARGVTVFTQNGWLPKTPELVIREYPESSFNQHPGPLPDFGGQGMYGRRVHAAVLIFRRLTRADPWTEAVAQRVHMEIDKGPVVKSQQVVILKDDTVDELQQRVLPVEHKLQVELLIDVAFGNVQEEPPRKSIVNLDNRQHLLLAKRIARLLYPTG